MAIGMKLKKAEAGHEPGQSKFFGDPTIPAWMEGEIEEDEVFLAQIKLPDIASLDPEHLLPHEGWLYFFLKAEDDSPWTPKEAVVRYSNEEPGMILGDFNRCSPIPEGMTEAWLVEFEPVEDAESGMKMLGVPNDWNYEDPAPLLLLQYDPLDSPSPFLSEMDGTAYFFAGKDLQDFTDAVWHAEYS